MNNSLGRSLHAQIQARLRDTCKEFIDNPRAPGIIITHLGRIGAKAIKENLLATENASRNTIVAVAQLCDRDTRIRLSVYCSRALNHMLKAAKDTATQDHLINKILDIYDRHLDKGWRDWLLIFLNATSDLMEEYPISTPKLWTRLVAHFFKYSDFFADKDMINEAREHYRKFIKIFYFLKEKQFPNYLTEPFLHGLKNYTEKYLTKEGQVWQSWGEGAHGKIFDLSEAFLKKEEEDLFRMAHMAYLPAICLGHLRKDALRMRFPSFVKQTLSFLVSNEHPVDSEWAWNIAEALHQGSLLLIRANRADVIVNLWKDINHLNIQLMHLALNKNTTEWIRILEALHHLFADLMWENHKKDTGGFIDQNEVFKKVALTISALPSVSPTHRRQLGLNLKDEGLLEEFIKSFEAAEKENDNQKISIPSANFKREREAFDKILKEPRP